ncbi:MAG: hypothetical protein R3C19_16975 [Planctomycetaceae bacterium]
MNRLQAEIVCPQQLETAADRAEFLRIRDNRRTRRALPETRFVTAGRFAISGPEHNTLR